MAEIKQGLFQEWVPKPVGLFVVFILTITAVTTNGLYSANIGDMASGLGAMAEYMSMASYASFIGMMLIIPLVINLTGAVKARTILLFSLSATLLLSLWCAFTTSMEVLILANFIMGGLKMLTLIEVIVPIMALISPDGNRGRFYAIFYPFSIVLGQLGSYVSAELAYAYSWQHVYYFMLPGLLLSLALVIIFCHNAYSMPYRPFEKVDWLSFFLITSSLMLLNYVLVFARAEDYFNSLRIQGATLGFVVTLLWFIRRQLTAAKPFLDLSMMKIRNVWASLIMILFVGLFLAAGGIQSAFTSGILHLNPLSNAELNLWMIPGILVGGVFLFYWNKYERNMKGCLLAGFGAFVLGYLLLYTKVNPGAGMHDFYLAAALRGFGMVVLFAGLGVYIALKLNMMQVLSSAAVLIVVRSFVGPALFSAVISFGMYHGQTENLQQLAQHMDVTSTMVATRAAASGGSLGLYGAVMPQAVLLTVQDMLGYVVIAGLWIMLGVLLFRFGSINRRRLVNWRKKWRGVVAGQVITT